MLFFVPGFRVLGQAELVLGTHLVPAHLALEPHTWQLGTYIAILYIISSVFTSIIKKF